MAEQLVNAGFSPSQLQLHSHSIREENGVIQHAPSLSSSSYQQAPSTSLNAQVPAVKSTPSGRGKGRKRIGGGRGGRGGGSSCRPPAPPKKKRRHHCSVQGCTYNTGHSKDLTRHMRKHTGEKPFNCNRCSKSFTRYDKLVMHIRIHDGLKKFSCKICDYAAIDSSSLKKHQRTHSDERPYKCNLCTYATKSSSQLVVHKRKHSGDAPYLCTFVGCEAAFKTPSDLTRHCRLHTGDKPYKCPQCDYRCAVKSNLNSHVKRHKPVAASAAGEPEEVEEDFDISKESDGGGGENETVKKLPFQYACRYCDERLDTLEAITTHMQETHKGKNADPLADKRTNKTKLLTEEDINQERPYRCSTCSAAFVSENSLCCHMRQHGTVPNKPANVDPQIYSPTPRFEQQQNLQQPDNLPPSPPPPQIPFIPSPEPTPIPQLPPQPQQQQLPSQLNLNPNQAYLNENLEDPNQGPQPPSTSYRLRELQKMPLIHSTLITDQPPPDGRRVTTSGTGTNIIQNHHYDPTTGHMYVITYNNVQEGDEQNVQEFNHNPINFVLNNNNNNYINNYNYGNNNNLN